MHEETMSREEIMESLFDIATRLSAVEYMINNLVNPPKREGCMFMKDGRIMTISKGKEKPYELHNKRSHEEMFND